MVGGACASFSWVKGKCVINWDSSEHPFSPRFYIIKAHWAACIGSYWTLTVSWVKVHSFDEFDYKALFSRLASLITSLLRLSIFFYWLASN